jgi:hypothetical protein
MYLDDAVFKPLTEPNILASESQDIYIVPCHE